MKFELTELEEDRGVSVEATSETNLTLSVGFIGSHAGYASLTREEALALAGAIRAMASALDRAGT